MPSVEVTSRVKLCFLYQRSDLLWFGLFFLYVVLIRWVFSDLQNTLVPGVTPKVVFFFSFFFWGGTGVPSLKLTYPLCFWPLKKEMFIGNHGIIVSQLRSRIFLGMVRYPPRGPYATAERISADSAQQFSEQMLTSIWSFLWERNDVCFKTEVMCFFVCALMIVNAHKVWG